VGAVPCQAPEVIKAERRYILTVANRKHFFAPQITIMPIQKYAIVLRGERFLSSDQLYFDAPNYFTNLFQGPFQEAAEGKRDVVLYRDPNLFRIIEMYLSGYQIFPLPDDGWTKSMSKVAARKNLIEDAKFYGFERLILLLEKGAKQAKEKRYSITTSKV
jgi:hypothetical protein